MNILTKRGLAILAAAAALLSLLAIAARGCAIARRGKAAVPGPTVLLYDDETGKTAEISLEEYIYGVVAAEMPASFEAEALKAQAVAARTFAARRIAAFGGKGCGRGGAELCTDSACCQSYRKEAALEERWGGEYPLYSRKIREAVRSTAGEVLTYGGEIAEALYHSTSGGATEAAADVFGSEVPYLVSVPSPGEERSAHFSDSVTYERDELAKALNAAFPGAKVRASKLDEQLCVLSRSGGGRVAAVAVGGVTATGRELRKALGLPSAAFTFDFGANSVRIDTAGYGHGVGMSQYGADAMAREGNGHLAILAHYYPGAEVRALYGE